MRRWWRIGLLAAVALTAGAAGTVLAIAINVATGGTAPWFPTMDRYPLRWTVAATLAAAVAGLLVWQAQKIAGPGGKGTPIYGRPVRRWAPLELGVHRVIGGGPMPQYISRHHDKLLRAALDPGVTASRLIVLRGGSSTGKSRAAYEAVAARLPGWRLDYPLTAVALAERLDANIPERTVLWLGELRHYAKTDSDASVLGRLPDLLNNARKIIVITTIWPETWTRYATATLVSARPGASYPAEVAGRLLTSLSCLTGLRTDQLDPARGGVVDVPPQFTAEDLQAAARTGDPALAAAAKAAAADMQEGQVTQYLAGVPDLLDRYAGAGGDPYGQAVIVAAMDATRLGYASPLPAALLADAAVGYLTDTQRTRDIRAWRDTALQWATEELRGAVRALKPVPPTDGVGIIGYQLADYLEQHSRRTRRDQLGQLSLWNTFAAHTTSRADLMSLASAAQDRGLHRHAAALLTEATSLGSTQAASTLIRLLSKVSPDDATNAAHWAVEISDVHDAGAVAEFLTTLRETGAIEAARALAVRAATGTRLNQAYGVARLLAVLREAGADDAAPTLAVRAASYVSLNDRHAVGEVLTEMHKIGASDASRTLASRATAGIELNDPSGTARLMEVLRMTGADEAARILAIRAATETNVDYTYGTAWLLKELRRARVGDLARTLADRSATQASLDNPRAVAQLLEELRRTGASDAARALAGRAATGTSLDNPEAIAQLLAALRETVAEEAIRILAHRAAAAASLSDPLAVAELLAAFRQAGADNAAAVLLARDPAGHTSVDASYGIARLLEELRRVQADAAARILVDRATTGASPGTIAALLAALRKTRANFALRILVGRAATETHLDDPVGTARLLEELRRAGAGEVACTLADRAATQARLDKPGAVAWLLQELRRTGADDAVRALASRAVGVPLDDPEAVAGLLGELCRAGADDAAGALASRAVGVPLGYPAAVAALLEELRRARADTAVGVLVRRAAAGTPLKNPMAIALLLEALREAGANDAAATLLARDPAAHVGLDNAAGIARLMNELHEAGADAAVQILIVRTANAGIFGQVLETDPRAAARYRFGLEPSGTPSESWRWHCPPTEG